MDSSRFSQFEANPAGALRRQIETAFLHRLFQTRCESTGPAAESRRAAEWLAVGEKTKGNKEARGGGNSFPLFPKEGKMKEFSLSSRAGPRDPTEPLRNAGISRAARIHRRERAGQGGGGIRGVADIQGNERWSG